MKRKLIMVLLATTLMATSVFAAEVSSNSTEVVTNQNDAKQEFDVDLTTQDWKMVYSGEINEPIVVSNSILSPGAIQIKVTEPNETTIVQAVETLAPGDYITLDVPTTESSEYEIYVRAVNQDGTYTLDVNQPKEGNVYLNTNKWTPIYTGTIKNGVGIENYIDNPGNIEVAITDPSNNDAVVQYETPIELGETFYAENLDETKVYDVSIRAVNQQGEYLIKKV